MAACLPRLISFKEISQEIASWQIQLNMSSNTGNIGFSNVFYKLSIMPVVCELAKGVLWEFQEQSKQTNICMELLVCFLRETKFNTHLFLDNEYYVYG